MQCIRECGGGLLLLLGSAGDGKSHLISMLRSSNDFADFVFVNDATESYSPKKEITAVNTLMAVLKDFNDSSIEETTQKMVLAINLGMLLNFIEDETVKTDFSTFVNSAKYVVEDVKNYVKGETERIKLISFAHQQQFELNLEDGLDYPVDSLFMRGILEKIANKSDDNPFFKSYIESSNSDDINNPVLLNYRLIQIPQVQNSIVKLIIESIVRFNLIVTPRDYLDFIHSIIVYPRLNEYVERTDFFSALLPSLLFNENGNKIQRAISQLDPLKSSSVEHDDQLSVLYSAFVFDPDFLDKDTLGDKLVGDLKDCLDRFYKNKNKDKIQLTTLIFRLNHLLNYHSECNTYKEFIQNLAGFYREDIDTYDTIEELVLHGIPRHYGSFIEEERLIPLNIQGSKYKLFATIDIPQCEFDSEFNQDKPYLFEPYISMHWDLDTQVDLKITYSLFDYLRTLQNGKLATKYEGERNLEFSYFIRQISKNSKSENEVKIVDSENKIHVLGVKHGKLKLN